MVDFSFKIMGPSKVLYTVNLSFKSEDEIKIFSGTQKLGEFVASQPVLLEILKELQVEMK